ncbi:hypothetical protein C162_12728 [Paenibacillus sp. FSL R7-269]|uniref:hypothetical protein n=1 Tax=Paenibacillus sp. FSL R7-269 TaxID=1226755 RepID=UPI0003E248A0|nr:hypothetical protein [Paenibacillus sp. FSL R7-269]ETT49752.1 hypothetical protein C162_12728 [Paenibacillus sp. FSL R7-269]
MNTEVWDGFRERVSILNPISMLGKGMDLGVALNPYLFQICLAVLLEVFYREIKDDDHRHFYDIKEIVNHVIEEQGLEATEDHVERIANGLVSFGPPQSRQSFPGKVFDPNTGEFVEKPFFYLTIDTAYSKKREAVYKLTQISQNMIFLSREVILEFSIEFEQLYTLKLIRNKNFKSALQSLDMLITKLRFLISQEMEYRRQFLRNPKIMMGPDKEVRYEKRKEIERQIKEADDRFESMLRMLQKSDLATLEARGQIMEMELKVRKSSELTTSLHTHMYENIELETSTRKNRPSAFMKKRTTSFKTDVWENELLAKGIGAPDTMELLLSPLFSPRPPFIYPLGWIWEEQNTKQSEDELEAEQVQMEQAVEKPKRDWSLLCRLWGPVFKELLRDSSVRLGSRPVSEWTLEALEMWMIFKTEPMHVPLSLGEAKPYPDERMELIRQLILLDPAFKEIAGKTIRAVFTNEAPLQFMGVRISPITIFIEPQEG